VDPTITRFKVSAKDGAIALPYYKAGQLTGVKYRAINEKKFWTEKDAEPCLFGRDLVRGDILYLCEGEFDAMALYQLGFDDGVVSIPNGVSDYRWVETEWEWLDRFKSIYLVMDTDLAGRSAAQELARKLGTWRCKDVILPHKDANECLLKKSTLEEISTCMAEAREYSPALLVDAEILTEEVVRLFIGGNRLKGVPTLWGELDEILGGWREEELTVWTGRTGAGKSTILNQHTIDIIGRDVKVCVASLEIAAPRYLRWAVIQATGRPDLMAAEIREAMKRFAGKLYVVNTHESIAPDALFEIFEYASRRYDVKHFIVDSLMRIVLPGKDDLREEKEFVSRLLSFAKKYKVHVHLVAHPRKASKDKEVPGVVDIKGSGHITDLAHNVLVHWRPTEEDIERAKAKHKSIPGGIIYVKKNRELGNIGRVRLTFDERSKTYADDFDEKE